ncbi:LLM class F420-dependent oxidoreductase [Kibdelosporangium aridum]|uniref:Probable F420-dependent oxidoreductase, MSMEG_4141 family n=1 Tax=Kibdelosporangium aridum TaxID=2030 RepID=A0A1W2FLK5_KIBAR|nr:LLM class F420-dependent oxidoreductase [Kibdelosporangium aridum]SMD22478.1 probable F420-dependent oxidoreductase, MSMEG_4141 family [Kibdelosporangium aridum]
MMGRFGVWQPLRVTTPAMAAEVEGLGFSNLWVSGATSELAGVDELLEATESLVIGTSVLNIWHGGATVAAASYHRLAERFPGRFLLGIGAGHPEQNQEFQSPMASITQYLDELDAGGVPVDGRAIAALGPKMLALAAERAVGSIPYSVTPEYTRRARAALGSRRILAPEHKVVLDTDPVRARQTNRDYIEAMLNLRHYRNSLRRVGFTDEDVTGRGSDRLYDALVAHGDVNTVAGKLTEHLDAGADHVAIQVMTNDRTTIPGLPKDITVQVYDDRVFAVYKALADELL